MNYTFVITNNFLYEYILLIWLKSIIQPRTSKYDVVARVQVSGMDGNIIFIHSTKQRISVKNTQYIFIKMLYC